MRQKAQDGVEVEILNKKILQQKKGITIFTSQQTSIR